MAPIFQASLTGIFQAILAQISRPDWPGFLGQMGSDFYARFARISRFDWPVFSGQSGKISWSDCPLDILGRFLDSKFNTLREIETVLHKGGQGRSWVA